MRFEWDENKRISNLEKHGLDFLDAYVLWDDVMVVVPDSRYEYGEGRYIALGKFYKRIVVCAYTLRGESIRIISLRKANAREVKYYEQVLKKQNG